jgi:type IV pilus modification protein PilV
MTFRQIKLATPRGDLGFSMIDVLIAIVVLATGLLALAALQGAMTRNSADARARSQIAAYAEGVIDQLRSGGYDNIAGATITPSTTPPTCPTTSTSRANQAYCAQLAAGVSNLTTTVTSAQYYGDGVGGFSTVAPTDLSGVALYKQVNVTTTWTDALGQAGRAVSFDTTVSPVTVDTTNSALINQTFTITTGNTPIVRETNPANTLGVIPIAISSSASAAATNPAPVVTNTGTTFSTFTYQTAASSYGGNVINNRVDTKVLQCGCQFGGAVTADSNSTLATILTPPYRPTYWDGTQYTSPALVGTLSSTSATGIDSTATQDTDCDVCCRDRNDSSSDPAGTIKFDSFSGTTSHYQYNSSGILTAVTSGTYVEACRLIRVGGVYATATDAHNYFFGMLATDNCAAETTPAPTGCTSSLTASDTVPSSSTETSYGNFVKDYLYNSLSSLSAGTGPWVASTDPVASPANNASNLYNGSPYTLYTPANITISLPNTVSRWLYARGLYIDHLETKAVTALTNAIANCGATDTTSVENCALPVLPFTTINMTELANWSSSSTAVIHVSDTAVIGGDESSPKRGNVTVPSSQTGSGNPTANAIASVYITNSGLTGVTVNQANSTYDTTTSNILTDQKQFTVSGTSSGGGSVYFDVALTGLSWMSAISNSSLDPAVGWSGTAAQLGTAASGSANAYLTKSGSTYTALYAGASSTAPIPVSESLTPPVGLSVNVQYFNTFDNKGTDSGTCTAISGGTAGTFTKTTATQCYNYAVNTSGITINGTTVSGATTALMSGTTDGGQKEGAVITLPSTPGISSTTNTIAGATSVSIPFTLTSTTVVPGTCTCTSSRCGSSKQTYIAGTCSN